MIEPKAELSVDFEIIQSNISYLKSLLREGAFMAIIKANAYGHSIEDFVKNLDDCLLYTSPSPRDQRGSRMPSSA